MSALSRTDRRAFKLERRRDPRMLAIWGRLSEHPRMTPELRAKLGAMISQAQAADLNTWARVQAALLAYLGLLDDPAVTVEGSDLVIPQASLEALTGGPRPPVATPGGRW